MVLSFVLHKIVQSIVMAGTTVTVESLAVMSLHVTSVVAFSNVQRLTVKGRLAPRDWASAIKFHLV